jgi:hypothetical protein
VSTDQECFAELGAHRAPYDKATAEPETASQTVRPVNVDSNEGPEQVDLRRLSRC